MNEYTRITVPLSKDEFAALRDTAGNEYRHPRDHARYLLREALGLTGETRPNANRASEILADPSAIPV
jgi:hypothetical protein